MILQDETLADIRARAQQLLNRAQEIEHRHSAADQRVAGLATLAIGLFTYAAERDLAETAAVGRAKLPDALAHLRQHAEVSTLDPESQARRAIRRDGQRHDGQPRRVDIYGMGVCECAGAMSAAPIVDGHCLRRWFSESLGETYTDEKSVETLLADLLAWREIHDREEHPARRQGAERVESDRFLVVLTCGHWMQTRVPEPNGGVFACPYCSEPRSAAKLVDAHGSKAVLGSWEPYDAPIADGE